jgi:hypothetical protein
MTTFPTKLVQIFNTLYGINNTKNSRFSSSTSASLENTENNLNKFNIKRKFSTTISNSFPNDKLPSHVKVDIKYEINEHFTTKVPKFKEPSRDQLDDSIRECDSANQVFDKYIAFTDKHTYNASEFAKEEKDKCYEMVTQKIVGKYPEL